MIDLTLSINKFSIFAVFQTLSSAGAAFCDPLEEIVGWPLRSHLHNFDRSALPHEYSLDGSNSWASLPQKALPSSHPVTL